MSYQIQYQPELDKQYPINQVKTRKNLPGLGVWLLLCFLLVCFFARDQLYDFLIPGEPDVTAGAFQQMIEQIRYGSPVGESVIGFCEDIISYAF